MSSQSPLASSFNVSTEQHLIDFHSPTLLSRSMIASSFGQVQLLLLFFVPTTAVKELDFCGIWGRDFFNASFVGENALAGPSCTLDRETDTIVKSGLSSADGIDKLVDKCHCANIFNDGQSLGEWVWQCNTPETADDPAVPYGPATSESYAFKLLFRFCDDFLLMFLIQK